ncbi:hypothetical protein C5167_007873 [Papaver somniferum]|nr:hypothetical protein C5167_007873 [Papaver somniferum]
MMDRLYSNEWTKIYKSLNDGRTQEIMVLSSGLLPTFYVSSDGEKKRRILEVLYIRQRSCMVASDISKALAHYLHEFAL